MQVRSARLGCSAGVLGVQPRVGALEEPKHSWQPSPQSTHSGRQPCGHQARRRRRDLPGPPVPAIRFPRIPASCSGFHAPPGRSNLRQGLEFEDKTSCFNFVVFQAPGFLTLVQGQRGSLGFSTCQALLGAELGRMASERLGVAVGPKSVLCPPPQRHPQTTCCEHLWRHQLECVVWDSAVLPSAYKGWGLCGHPAQLPQWEELAARESSSG